MGTAILIGIVVVLVLVFRARRKREIAQFREANYADFVDFDSRHQPTDSDSDIEQITRLASTAIEKARVAHESEKLTSHPYQIRERLFDELTGSIAGSLGTLAGESHVLLLRVPLDQLLSNADAKVTGLHSAKSQVDFVLCRKTDRSPECAVMMDRAGLQPVKEVLEAAGLPMLILKPGQPHSLEDLRSRLPVVLPDQGGIRRCQGCSEEMAVKQFKKDNHASRYYWVCNRCKVTLPVR